MKIIRMLTVSKEQIEESVHRILEYNAQYLEIIQDNERYIGELEEWRVDIENMYLRDDGCYKDKRRHEVLAPRETKR